GVASWPPYASCREARSARGVLGRLGRGLRRLRARPLDAVAAHLVVDARAVDAEALGRLALVAAREAERLGDRELLHLLERQVGRHERMLVVGAAVDLRGEGLWPQGPGLAGDHAPLALVHAAAHGRRPRVR